MGVKVKAFFVVLILSLVFLHSKSAVYAQGITTCQTSVSPTPYTYSSGNKRFIYSDSGDVSGLAPDDQALVSSGQLPLLGPSSTIQVSITTALNPIALASNGPFVIVLEGGNKTLNQGEYALSGNTFTFSVTALSLVNSSAGTISAIIQGPTPNRSEICLRSDVSNLFQVVDVSSASVVQAPKCSQVQFSPALSTLTAASSTVTATLPIAAFDSKDLGTYSIDFIGRDISNNNVEEAGGIVDFGGSRSAPTITVSGIGTKATGTGTFTLLKHSSNGDLQVACTLASFITNPDTGGVDPIDQGTGAANSVPFALCDQVADTDRSECIKCVSSGNITDPNDQSQKFWTAFGCISTTKEGIITSLLRVGIGISGGFVLLSILYGAFLLTTSSGEPKRVQEGQEMITSAIMGLIFVILSIIILRFIGVSILQIPGFGT